MMIKFNMFCMECEINYSATLKELLTKKIKCPVCNDNEISFMNLKENVEFNLFKRVSKKDKK